MDKPVDQSFSGLIPIGGLSREDIIEMENKFEVPLYSKRDIVLTEGKGAILVDIDGKEYIDCVSGIGVASIGHSNEYLTQALTQQMNRLITGPEIFYNDRRAQLLKILNDITHPDLYQIFLSNSGTEAIEAAIKFARATTGKSEFVSMVRGFHGRTMGALSATFNKHYKDDFEPLVPGFHFAPFNKIEKVKDLINDNTAGIIIELIQGNGGVHIAEQEFVNQLRQLCDERSIILIFDEVQTGFCRTGNMFAMDSYGVIPDILCLAKAMGGGIPIAATICTSRVKIGPAKHGSTFGGNPLACAAAVASIEFMLQNNLATKAKEKGDYLAEKLNTLDSSIIRKIRHKGLLIGIECKQKVGEYILDLQDQGVLVNSASSNVIRLLPPLVIRYDQIDQVIASISKVLK